MNFNSDISRVDSLVSVKNKVNYSIKIDKIQLYLNIKVLYFCHHHMKHIEFLLHYFIFSLRKTT